jgi:hypothetical protein
VRQVVGDGGQGRRQEEIEVAGCCFASAHSVFCNEREREIEIDSCFKTIERYCYLFFFAAGFLLQR